MGSDFGHKFTSEIGTPVSSDFGIVPISDAPYSDVHCIVFFIQVYVGKVQVSRHQLKSFLKSAEILRIRGLVQSNHSTDNIFDRASTDEKLSASNSSQREPLEPIEDELNSKRQSEIPPSDPGGSKRPRLQSRPVSKPVTTTITPGKGSQQA